MPLRPAHRYRAHGLVLDILQGAGLAAASASGPSCPRSSPARSRPPTSAIDFDGTDFAFLEQWPFLLASWSLVVVRSTSPRGGAATAAWRAAARAGARALVASCSARCVVAGTLADHGEPGGPASSSAPPCAALGASPPAHLFARVRARGSTPRPRAALPVYAEGAALALAALSILLAAARARRRSARSSGCCSAAAGARARSTRACGSCGDGRRAEARPRGHRRDEAGDARAGDRDGAGAGARAAHGARPLRRRLRRGLPVGDARSARRRSRPAPARTATDPVDELVPPRGGRYVEYGTSFKASRRFGIRRSLTDTIYNMNGEHLSRRRRDGLRVARRRRACAPPARRTSCTAAATSTRSRDRDRARRGMAADGLPPARHAARASSSTPTSSRRARRAAARSSGCRACATSTRAASAPTWSSTTCSTSCCSRCPTTTPTRTSNGPYAQVASIAAADRQIERVMHAGRRARRLPRRPRGDRRLRPLAVAGRGGRSTSSAAFDELGVLPPPGARGARGRRDRALPGLALGAGLRARPGAPRASSLPRSCASGARASTASTS